MSPCYVRAYYLINARVGHSFQCYLEYLFQSLKIMTVTVNICVNVIVCHLMNNTNDNQNTKDQLIDLSQW